jgi:hypothetical protein
MHKRIAIITASCALCMATCEKETGTTSDQPPTFDQAFNEGLVIAGRESSIGSESLPDPAIFAAILNAWTWTLPVTLPDDVITFGLRLDHYQHDQWVSTLATSDFHRLTHQSQLGTGVPTDDEISIILRFPTEAATRVLATTRSEKGFLLTTAKHMSEGRLEGSEFPNPFFGKEPQVTTGRVPLPLELGTDASPEAHEARRSSIDTRSRQMSENFQIGVLHSNDGTNLRLTFSIRSRFHPPRNAPSEKPDSELKPTTANPE